MEEQYKRVHPINLEKTFQKCSIFNIWTKTKKNNMLVKLLGDSQHGQSEF